ncbi:hypothetical protein BLNAU_8657 [Blattamonas nauphoetae]|uniref:Uncharacterized protein n=1 Tax=Blattamonas nauphoetae TaxID=2049346 RepID=A0ABQ9XY97_9EUKA|nr:hypothetical protein BLNAU_8657 [Blattamonas nauphoetae]
MITLPTVRPNTLIPVTSASPRTSLRSCATSKLCSTHTQPITHNVRKQAPLPTTQHLARLGSLCGRFTASSITPFFPSMYNKLNPSEMVSAVLSSERKEENMLPYGLCLSTVTSSSDLANSGSQSASETDSLNRYFANTYNDFSQHYLELTPVIMSPNLNRGLVRRMLVNLKHLQSTNLSSDTILASAST